MSSLPLSTEINTKEATQTSSKNAGVPWYIWFGTLAVTSSSIGGAWDIAWHRSIGRDTFWTPAHMAIQACGVMAAIICAYLIAVNTFGSTTKLKTPAVNVLGFHAPLGAFIAAWGGIAMITSAPFDNWWHAAYGVDIKIISPPHALLILGGCTVNVGILFLIIAAMNRTQSDPAPSGEKTFLLLRLLFLYVGGLIVGGQMLFLMEYTWDIRLHSASPYIAIGIAVPLVFAILSQASRYKWAATSAAAIYTIIAISEILIFPLFPAQPKLGPVFNPVTHLIPAKFPILIFLPALALDLLWQKTRTWKPWKVAIVSGFLFITVLIIVEWPFATFLLSKASENRFFGTIYFNYNSRPDSFDRLRQFSESDQGIFLYLRLLRAAVYASISTWIGLSFGRWIRSVQR
jgi:hypothetical protein